MCSFQHLKWRSIHFFFSALQLAQGVVQGGEIRERESGKDIPVDGKLYAVGQKLFIEIHYQKNEAQTKMKDYT